MCLPQSLLGTDDVVHRNGFIMPLVKRSLSLNGHRTSVALEPEFWAVLEAEAARTGKSAEQLVADIDRQRGDAPLASSLRVHALNAARTQN